jgi:DNA-binding MarR family transcriptional regulator
VEQLSAVSRALRGAAADVYATLGLGPTQAKVLRALGREGVLSQAQLARLTLTAPALTGRALETLVARKWVHRRRSTEDRRQYVLELTASGQRLRQRVEAAREQLAARVGDVLDRRDLEDFDRVATKVLSVLDAQGSPWAG